MECLNGRSRARFSRRALPTRREHLLSSRDHALAAVHVISKSAAAFYRPTCPLSTPHMARGHPAQLSHRSAGFSLPKREKKGSLKAALQDPNAVGHPLWVDCQPLRVYDAASTLRETDENRARRTRRRPLSRSRARTTTRTICEGVVHVRRDSTTHGNRARHRTRTRTRPLIRRSIASPSASSTAIFEGVTHDRRPRSRIGPGRRGGQSG